MTIHKKITALRKLLEQYGIDAFLIPRADEHQSEYVAKCDERVQYISDFTGSAGTVLVTKDKAALFTDGRYTIQATRQIDEKIFELCHITKYPLEHWILENLTNKLKIGFDPRLHTPKQIKNISKIISKKNITLLPLENNLLDMIWEEQPKPPMGNVVPHKLIYSGKSSKDKRALVANSLNQMKINAILISAPENLCWVFNLRGNDVPMTPVAFGYAIIEENGNANLFMKTEKLSNAILIEIKNDKNITLNEPSLLPAILKKFSGKKILFDEETANIALILQAERAYIKPYIQTDPIYLMKAQKNEIELNGIRAAHLRDSTAVIKFIKWFLESDPVNLNEWSAAMRLQSEREKLELYQGASFPTISATERNAAEAHYQLNKNTAKQILDGHLFLFDSGGQFLDGTTDITRVLAVGNPTTEMKFNYTLVLKGHIAIHLAQFPNGTTGQQLDPLARQFLWSEGLDYDHGTGHGVGHYLSVHEGPQRISKTSNIPLEIGMILSNEPGFYKENSYGIRIENLMIVKEIQKLSLNPKKSIYGFETLSFVPYDTRLINKEQLEEREINWINSYHSEIIEKITPLLDLEHKKFLQSIATMI